MKTSACRGARLLVVAIAVFSAAACSSPTPVSQPDARTYWNPDPQELFPAYSYKRAGGG